MKKILLLLIIGFTVNANAEWSLVAEDAVAKYYYNMASLRADPEPFSDGAIVWRKVTFNTARTKGNISYDEVSELLNVDCNKQAMKFDERIIKLKDKVVFRQSQDALYIPTYSYIEPDSPEMLQVEDVCYAWNKLQSMGFDSWQALLDETARLEKNNQD